MSIEEPAAPPSPAVAAFEKVPFENDASILWKHVTARRFRLGEESGAKRVLTLLERLALLRRAAPSASARPGVLERARKDTFYPATLQNFTAGGKVYGIEAVYQDKNGGFASPEVVKAFQLFRAFAALQPFQKGYLANTYAGNTTSEKAAKALEASWQQNKMQ